MCWSCAVVVAQHVLTDEGKELTLLASRSVGGPFGTDLPRSVLQVVDRCDESVRKTRASLCRSGVADVVHERPAEGVETVAHGCGVLNVHDAATFKLKQQLVAVLVPRNAVTLVP